MTRSQETMLRLQYALAKQVDDIACHAVFETSYGQLRLDADDSQKVAELVGKLLRKKVAQAKQQAAEWCTCGRRPPACTCVAREVLS